MLHIASICGIFYMPSIDTDMRDRDTYLGMHGYPIRHLVSGRFSNLRNIRHLAVEGHWIRTSDRV